jgi:hypothetical protein
MWRGRKRGMVPAFAGMTKYRDSRVRGNDGSNKGMTTYLQERRDEIDRGYFKCTVA